MSLFINELINLHIVIRTFFNTKKYAPLKLGKELRVKAALPGEV